MWNTWNIHRLMNPLKIFQAPVNKDFPNATEFARGEMSHDTNSLCETVQKAVAYYTGEGRAMEDFFLIDIKATDSSGATTSQHSDTDGQHKTRYTFYHKNLDTGEWETEHQGEIMGGMGEGWTSSPLHLITKSGLWKVVIDPVQSGTCALPSGTKNIGEMWAKEATCEGQNRTSNSDDTCGECIEGYVENEYGLCSTPAHPQGEDTTLPTDYQNLMMLGVGLAGLALVLSKKRKKKAKAE